MTDLVLDTHVVAWLVSEPDRLSVEVLATLAAPGQRLFVSAISAYEVAQKVRLGKWAAAQALAAGWEELVAGIRVTSLPVSAADALTAGRLAWAHRDPFDRMIASQTMLRGYRLVSADQVFQTLPGLSLLEV